MRSPKGVDKAEITSSMNGELLRLEGVSLYPEQVASPVLPSISESQTSLDRHHLPQSIYLSTLHA
jgi:hypothetical protein